jgi:hypothetical protein
VTEQYAWIGETETNRIERAAVERLAEELARRRQAARAGTAAETGEVGATPPADLASAGEPGSVLALPARASTSPPQPCSVEMRGGETLPALPERLRPPIPSPAQHRWPGLRDSRFSERLPTGWVRAINAIEPGWNVGWEPPTLPVVRRRPRWRRLALVAAVALLLLVAGEVAAGVAVYAVGLWPW